jgi:hypothetical protein
VNCRDDEMKNSMSHQGTVNPTTDYIAHQNDRRSRAVLLRIKNFIKFIKHQNP